MPSYKTMYFTLAARVADAIDILVSAQQQGEEQYMRDEEKPGIYLADESREDD